MGISIGTNRKELSMGYGSFMVFRVEIAKAFSKKFGEKYEAYLRDTLMNMCHPQALDLIDKRFNEYLSTVKIPDDVLDFLFQSDVKGKITYTTARKIRDLCNKSTYKNKFGYYSDTRTMQEIAEIFDDAVKHRCNVKWS